MFNMNPPPSRAIFLDRDGTLHEDKGYLIRFEDFRPLPGVVEALQLLQSGGFRLFVASNQSGVARGMFSLEEVLSLNRKIQEYFRGFGINIEEMAICPHHPQGIVGLYARDCECRKPKPGMLFDLALRHGLDLPRSFMVGDNLRDAQAGSAAGATGVLIPSNPDAIRLDSHEGFREFGSLLEFAQRVTGAETSHANG